MYICQRIRQLFESTEVLNILKYVVLKKYLRNSIPASKKAQRLSNLVLINNVQGDNCLSSDESYEAHKYVILVGTAVSLRQMLHKGTISSP